jgi:hypothetical protein
VLTIVRELRQPTIGQRPTAIIDEVGKTLAKLGCYSLRGTIPDKLSVGWSRIIAECLSYKYRYGISTEIRVETSIEDRWGSLDLIDPPL